MKDVLILNSYGGSLILGTKAAGFPIRGSYEDAGFGMEAQKLNFPELNFVEKLPWPDDDLSETVVIAHPPCAPFSVHNFYNNSKDPKNMGIEADGFQCHRNVMEYSLGKGCQALTIESVPGVMKVAEEYQGYAIRFGYSVYFLRLNSISFGVPQWRPRVWIIFVKGGQPFGVNLKPAYQALSTITQTEGTLCEAKEGTGAIKRLEKAKVPVPDDTLRKIFEGEYGTGNLLSIGKEVLGIEDAGDNFIEVRKAWNLEGVFGVKMPRILDPNAWATTLLHDAAWFIHGRPLLLEEYNLIMGFPKDYQWPDSYSDPRVYLSKGVCPPVVTWILNQIRNNLEKGLTNRGTYLVMDNTAECQPGELLDLCPKKKDVEKALRGEAPEPPKVRKPRQEKLFKAPTPRVKVQASDLAAQFLASLRRDDAKQ